MIILEGKTLSEQIILEQKGLAEKLKPVLAVILVGENPASQLYVRNKKRACKKAGIETRDFIFSETVTQKELLIQVEKCNADPSIHGILVQLPLPAQIDMNEIIRTIDPKKDVDGFHALNVGKACLGEENEGLPPATALGILRLLDYYDIELQGKHVVIVGHSNIVGKPATLMMLNRNATVTTCNIYTPNLQEMTRMADILITAVGKENLIIGSMVKKGAVVIDVGINRKEDGTFCGDVNFEEVSKVAGAITPVPGGIGPMTIAALILNIIKAAQLQINR